MKTDFSEIWMLLLAALLGGVGGGMVGHEVGTRVQVRDDNREAVKVGHARWASGENGEPVFQWAVCTAPMGILK